MHQWLLGKWRRRGAPEGITKGQGETFGGDNIFSALTVMMVSQVYKWVKLYPTEHFKYVQLIACQFCLNYSIF